MAGSDRDVGRVIEVALGVGIFEVGGWRNDGITDAERAESHLHCAGAA